MVRGMVLAVVNVALSVTVITWVAPSATVAVAGVIDTVAPLSVMVIVVVSEAPLVTSVGGVPRAMMTVSPVSAAPSVVALSVNVAVVVLAATVTVAGTPV